MNHNEYDENFSCSIRIFNWFIEKNGNLLFNLFTR